MTTCFAHLVRGEWNDALRANPAGVLLALLCALAIPWLWASAWQGETIGVRDPVLTLLMLVIVQACVTAAVWVWRMRP